MDYLYNEIELYKKFFDKKDIPDVIKNNLSKKIILRNYQNDAFSNFISYYEDEKLFKNKQIHTLFHMATGSGKTVIMAGLILYLYENITGNKSTSEFLCAFKRSGIG